MKSSLRHTKPSINLASATLREYWKHIKKNRLQFFTALFAVPASALCLATFVPYYLSKAVGQLATSSHSVAHQLYMAVAFGILGTVFNFVGFRILIKHEALMQTYIHEDLTKQLLDRDYSFFSNEKIGALTTRFNDFVKTYANLQDLFIIRTLGFVISMGVGLVLVAINSWQLALILLALLVVLAIQVRVSMNIRKPYRFKRKYLASDILGEIADALTNNLIVKIFAQEKGEFESIRKKSQRHMKIYIKDFNITVTDGTLRQFITTAVQIIAILFAVTQLRSGRIDIATTIFALAYLQRIAAQIFTLGEMINGYDNAFLQAAPMTEILLKSNKINDVPHASELMVNNGSIHFNNVTYNYEEGDLAINQLDYKIPGGKRIGVVGHSGAGKTTITRLLLRFDDATSGTIEIDGQDISKVSQNSLRSAGAYVPQEPLLFHRSLAENIRYGDLTATDKEVEKAARQAHAHEFIKDLPSGYQTIVGERGVKLSGGQRQRVAIARAILKKAPILILDEATSALDSESEVLIQKALDGLMKGRTTIVIAHRLSTIQKMDEIIVLESGTIIEEGSHAELLGIKGVYAKLWAHQSGGFIED